MKISFIEEYFRTLYDSSPAPGSKADTVPDVFHAAIEGLDFDNPDDTQEAASESESHGSELEEPQNSLTPIVAYIVEQGRSWNRQPDDHKDIAVMKALYDFTNNPNNDQIRALAEAAHTTHDKTFRELLVKGVDMELAGLHEALLDALGDIIADIESWNPSLSANATRLAYEIGAWPVDKDVRSIQGALAQFDSREIPEWDVFQDEAVTFFERSKNRQLQDDEPDEHPEDSIRRTIEKLLGDVDMNAPSDDAEK